MERGIILDGKEVRLVANGATPRIYRGLFRKDVFVGMANAVDENGNLLDAEVFENLAFTMAMQGGSVSTGTKIEDWLASMENPLAIVDAAADIMAIWTADTETTSEEKKE